MDNSKKLIQKIAYLESVNDLLRAELESLDLVSRKLGFPKGLKSLKAAAEELLQDQEFTSKDDASFSSEDVD